MKNTFRREGMSAGGGEVSTTDDSCGGTLSQVQSKKTSPPHLQVGGGVGLFETRGTV